MKQINASNGKGKQKVQYIHLDTGDLIFVLNVIIKQLDASYSPQASYLVLIILETRIWEMSFQADYNLLY